MGKNASKQLKDLMEHPENEADFRKVFASLDANHDGSLSLSEFSAASDLWWAAIRGGATDHVKAELRAEIEQKAPLMKSLMAKIGVQAVDLLAQESDLKVEQTAWTSRMFQVADRNGDGSVSFDEFLRFVRHEALEEQQEREAELREQLSANMRAHGGNIHVVKGGQSVRVDVPGLDVERFERKDRLHLHVVGRDQKVIEWSDTYKPRGYLVHSEKAQVCVVALEIGSSASSHWLSIDGQVVEAVETRLSDTTVRLALPESLLIGATPRRIAISAETGQLLCTVGDPGKQGIGRGCFRLSRYGSDLDQELGTLIVMDLIIEEQGQEH